MSKCRIIDFHEMVVNAPLVIISATCSVVRTCTMGHGTVQKRILSEANRSQHDGCENLASNKRLVLE